MSKGRALPSSLEEESRGQSSLLQKRMAEGKTLSSSLELGRKRASRSSLLSLKEEDRESSPLKGSELVAVQTH